MQKFVYTQYTPGHVMVPVLDDKGKVTMHIPDEQAVAAAHARNKAHEEASRRALKASMLTQNKLKGIKTPVTDEQIARARIATLVRVPVATPMVKDVILVKNGQYELDETSERVKTLVALGHLVPVVPVGVVKNGDAAAEAK